LEKEAKPTRDYFELLFFVLLWIAIFLVLAALLFSKHVGFLNAMYVYFWYWIFILIVFLIIIALNSITLKLTKTFKMFKRKKP
jgi:hypothetical protein